jgi:hypothetical protein
MFLKIATLLAILGLLLSLLLSLIQQVMFVSGRFQFYSSSMMMVLRILSFIGTAAWTVPLIIFFVAFFLNLKTKPADGLPK